MLSLLTDTIVSFADFSRNLQTYVSKARRGQPVSVSDSGKADLLLVKREQVARLLRRLEELEALVETYEILSDPEMLEDIHRSEADIAAGRTVSLDELALEWGLS